MQVGDKTYAFIAIERIGGIMAYDITNPAKSTFVNYINSRDFSEAIKGDVSPEGLCVAKINDGRSILLAACEVSGTLAANALKNNKKVTTVVIGKNVKSIGKKAFYGCKKLKKVTVKSSKLKKVGAKAFTGTNKKITIKVPAKKVKAYKKLLKNKGLKTLNAIK